MTVVMDGFAGPRFLRQALSLDSGYIYALSESPSLPSSPQYPDDFRF